MLFGQEVEEIAVVAQIIYRHNMCLFKTSEIKRHRFPIFHGVKGEGGNEYSKRYPLPHQRGTYCLLALS